MVQFDPPLSTAVSVAAPPTVSPESCLRLYATLSHDEHASFSRGGTKVQVWSDCGTGEWSETSFKDEHDVQDGLKAAVDLSLTDVGDGAEAVAPEETVTLVATMRLPPLVGRTVQFTYRILHGSGAVTWLGNTGTNGSISVETSHDAGLRAEEWHESTTGVLSWSASASTTGPVMVTKLGQDADWRGWAIGKEGPSSFTVVSSAVIDRVALALLPKARPGAYVSYAPILYHTTGNGTLSLTDSGEIVFQPRDGDSVLHASTLAESWTRAISDKTPTLDLHSPHFLGISGLPNANVQCIHILPVSGSKACITLSSSDFKPFTSPSDALFLVDSASCAAKYLVTSSPENLSVSVGPGGGKLFILPGYNLQNEGREWSVACLPRRSGRVTPTPVDTKVAARSEDAASSTEYTTSESTSSIQEWLGSKDVVSSPPQEHPSNALEAQILLLMLHMLRFFLGLVSLSISPPPPSQASSEPTGESAPTSVESPTQKPSQSEVTLTPQSSSRIAFEVTSGFAVFVKGEISKIALSVGGKLLKSTSKDMGGVWLLESETGSDNPQLLNIALRG